MSRRQQGSVQRLRTRGNKGSKTSGDDSAVSKLHKKIKKRNTHMM